MFSKSFFSLIITLGVLIQSADAMDHSVYQRSQKTNSALATIWGAACNLPAYIKHLLGSSTPRTVASPGIDYLSQLPDELIINYIAPYAITSYNLESFDGVRQAIATLLSFRNCNRRLRALMPNAEIARIIKQAGAHVNAAKEFCTYDSTWPSNQYGLMMRMHTPAYAVKTSQNMTLLQWAQQQTYDTLSDILIKAGAQEGASV